MDIITSRQNPLIAETAKLKDKKYRDETKTFLFEGIKLTKEALSSKVDIVNIFLTEKCAKKYPFLAEKDNAVIISESVLSKISENSAPEGIVCTARYIKELHQDYKDGLKLDPCLFLSTIQDPGNLGTIMRTAAAFGTKKLILSYDCADIYNQKTIRASMGAVFRMKTYRTNDLCKTIKDFTLQKVSVYATALNPSAIRLQDVNNTKDCCFVLGNEGHGLSQDVIDSCSGTVIIPMEEGAESLNVSSAAAVLLWEAYR